MKRIPQKEKTSSIRFKYVANQWLKEASSELKASSIAKYRNIVDLYLLSKLGERRIDEIDRAAISELISELLTTGGVRNQGLRPSTINTILSVVKRILDYAYRETGRPSVCFRKLRVNVQKESVEVLSDSNREKLWTYLLGNLSPCNLGILLCLGYGLRIGEICALRWSDFDFDSGVLSISRSLTRRQTFAQEGKKTEIVITSPKSAFSERKIPLAQEHIECLNQLRREDDAYVLTGKTSRSMEPRVLSYHFKKILQACDVRPIKFHSLRHSFATRWIELGANLKTLSEILGHSSVTVTLNYYVHPSLESKRQNVSYFARNAFRSRRSRKS